MTLQSGTYIINFAAFGFSIGGYPAEPIQHPTRPVCSTKNSSVFNIEQLPDVDYCHRPLYRIKLHGNQPVFADPKEKAVKIVNHTLPIPNDTLWIIEPKGNNDVYGIVRGSREPMEPLAWTMFSDVSLGCVSQSNDLPPQLRFNDRQLFKIVPS